MTEQAVQSGGMPKPLLAVLAAAGVVVMIGGVGALVASQSGPPDPLSDPEVRDRVEALSALSIPEFNAVDQDGTPVDRSIFEGRYTVLAFTFTYCPLACPVMNSHLGPLHAATRDLPDLQIVSFSVDPTHDTPERLRAHADSLGANTDRWRFLSTDEAAIEAVVERGLMFALNDQPEMQIEVEGGETMANIVHPTKFLLVSPDVRVIEMIDGMSMSAAQDAEQIARTWIEAHPPA